jgi:hypothetical protein
LFIANSTSKQLKGDYMPRRKKVAVILEDANTRLAGIKSIKSDLDLGNGLNVGTYTEKIEKTAKSLSEYNTILAAAEEKHGIFEANELDLKDYHERMLLAVGANYGKNSAEYEMAGGKKKSDRKHSTKSKTPDKP